jgi:hypothetical protein
MGLGRSSPLGEGLNRAPRALRIARNTLRVGARPSAELARAAVVAVLQAEPLADLGGVLARGS